MAVYRRPRQRFVLLVVTLLSVTVITLDQRGQGDVVIDRVRDWTRDALVPVQSGVDSAISPVTEFFEGVFRYGDLKEENARLRRQIEEQRGRTDRAANIEREYKELVDLEGLTFTGDIPSVTARVVSTSPSNFENTFQIDKGTSEGVAEGMPVVAGEGLVGRVSEASSRRATILLVTDPASSVGAKLSGSGVVGVARGRGSGQPLQIDFVAPGTPVDPGETLVTSGLQGAVFPAGVPVGTITSVRSRPGALQQSITASPAVDLRRVTFVRVLQWSPA